MEFTPYPNNNLRLFRIISFQFQCTPVGFHRAGDAGEMNPEHPPFFNLFYPVSHFFAEVKMALFKFQGFVFFCADSNGSGDFCPANPLR